MAITAAAGGGNWSANATWVGNVAPTAADDVLLANTSGAVTIDGTSGSPNLCRSLDCTGYTNTLTLASAKQLNIGDASGGSMTIVSGMTYAPNGSGTIKFVSTTTGNTLKFGGKNIPNLTFDGVNGAWTFSDAPAAGNTPAFTLTNGSVNTNGQNITANLSSSNSNARTLTLGTTNWTITTNTPWDTSNSTGMTLSAGSSTLTHQTSSGIATFKGGGLTFGTLTCTTLTTGSLTITGANTFGTLTVSNGAALRGALILSANQTVTGTFTSNGNSVTNRMFVRSDTRGTQRTITAAVVTVTNIDFCDIVGAGADPWSLASVTGLSGDCGGNSGITFTSPINCYWKADTGSWSTASLWKTASNGAVTARTPLPQDTAVFDGSSFTAGAKTTTLDVARTGNIDFTLATNTPAFASGSNAWECYGSLTLISAMTHTGTGGATLRGQGSFNFDGGTLTWPTSSTLTVDAGTGTYALIRNTASNSSLTVTTGTLNGAFTTSFTTLTVQGGTFTVEKTCTLTGATSVTSGTLGNGTVGGNITGGTTFNASGGTVNIDGFSGTTWSSGGSGSSCDVTIGATGISCSSFVANTNTGTIGTFTSGAGQVLCSSTASLGPNNGTSTITIGSGGLKATTISSGTSPGTINMGSGTWEATSTGTVWSMNAAATVNANTSTILLSDTSASAKTFAGGGKTYNNMTISGAASNGIVTFTGSNTFNGTLTFSPDSSVKFTSATTTTCYTFNATGTSGHVVTLAAVTAASAATIIAKLFLCDWMSIKDSTAKATGICFAGANSTNVSGNTNWIFTAPYYITDWKADAPDIISRPKSQHLYEHPLSYVFTPVAAVTNFYADAWSRDSVSGFARKNLSYLLPYASYISNPANIGIFYQDAWVEQVDTRQNPARNLTHTYPSLSYSPNPATIGIFYQDAWDAPTFAPQNKARNYNNFYPAFSYSPSPDTIGIFYQDSWDGALAAPYIKRAQAPFGDQFSVFSAATVVTQYYADAWQMMQDTSRARYNGSYLSHGITEVSIDTSTPPDVILLGGGPKDRYSYLTPYSIHKEREHLAKIEREIKEAEERKLRAVEFKNLYEEKEALEAKALEEIGLLLIERERLIRRVRDDEETLIVLYSMPFTH